MPSSTVWVSLVDHPLEACFPTTGGPLAGSGPGARESRRAGQCLTQLLPCLLSLLHPGAGVRMFGMMNLNVFKHKASSIVSYATTFLVSGSWCKRGWGAGEGAI